MKQIFHRILPGKSVLSLLAGMFFSGGLTWAQVTVDPVQITLSTSVGTAVSDTLIFTNTSPDTAIFTIASMDQTQSFRRPEVLRDIVYPDINHNPLPLTGFLNSSDITFLNDDGGWIEGIRCATPQPSEAENMRTQSQVNDWLERYGRQRDARDQVNILVAFHVIHNSSGTGNIPDQWIEDQVQVLNDAYAEYGIQFTLDVITRTENNAWFTGMNTYESTYKAALAVDPAHYLNIYTGQPSGGILGWSWLPSSFPETSYMHGVVLLYSTLPGGSSAPYNLGDTATHEVGHYLGLRHTFLNGCSVPGDYVADTPYQDDGDNIYSCNQALDTCPQEGTDPVHNFMNYTDDQCLTEFTVLQGERMWNQINVYRPSLLENAIGLPWIITGTEILVVPGNGSATLPVILDAADLEAGVYLANLVFTAADTAFSDIIVPVAFTATAEPAIVFSSDTIDLGTHYTGYPETFSIPFSNQGAADLMIGSIQLSDSSIVYLGPDSLTIGPDSSFAFSLRLQALAPDTVEAVLSFHTNDTAHTNVAISIRAVVLDPPMIQVSADSLWFSNGTAESLSREFTLRNDGASPLHFDYYVVTDILTQETPVDENFTTCELPDSWSRMTTSGAGWQIGDSGGSSGFPIPPGVGCYAYVNDDSVNGDGLAEYLITPELDFTGTTNIFLFFSSYFSGASNQTASVRYSSDDGNTWTNLYNIAVFSNWHTTFISLNSLVNLPRCRIGFFTSDNGGHGSGLAIDNVIINGTYMVPWVALTPAEGSLAAGDSLTITATIDTAGLAVGQYQGQLNILSNDPAEPELGVAMTLDIETLAIDGSPAVPGAFSLYQNFPNPFNPVTTIRYDLPLDGIVKIAIYDILGREIDLLDFGHQPAGRHEWVWRGQTRSGTSAGAGIYIYRMTVTNAGSALIFSDIKKMILLK